REPLSGGDRPRQGVVILVTAPDEDTARAIARELVERSLAACVNLVPGITSLYRWEGRVEESAEVLMVIKTVAARVGELEREVLRLHPYRVPEFGVIEPRSIGARYLDWLVSATPLSRA